MKTLLMFAAGVLMFASPLAQAQTSPTGTTTGASRSTGGGASSDDAAGPVSGTTSRRGITGGGSANDPVPGVSGSPRGITGPTTTTRFQTEAGQSSRDPGTTITGTSTGRTSDSSAQTFSEMTAADCANLSDMQGELSREEFGARQRFCIQQNMGTLSRTPGDTSASTSMNLTRSPRANRSSTSPSGIGPGKGNTLGSTGRNASNPSNP